MARMSGWRRVVFVALGTFASAVGAGCDRAEQGGSATTQASRRGGGFTLAVIPKGTTHVFWKSVEAGARKAADEAGATIVWKGPLKENDRAQQIQIVDEFVAEGVSGIVLAPLDDTALQRPVANATAKNIPVVIMDSGLKGEAGTDFVSFVGTDNRRGGEMAGEELAKLIGGKGKVVLIRYLEGSASTTEREEGFLAVMKKHPDIQVISSSRFGGPTAENAKKLGLSMIDTLREADGIFGSNEPMVLGVLQALRDKNHAGKVKFVGFDATDPLVQALKKGELQAVITQNPGRIGYDAVSAMVKKLKGETVPPRIDTGVYVVTKDNLDTPQMRELLGTKAE